MVCRAPRLRGSTSVLEVVCTESRRERAGDGSRRRGCPAAALSRMPGSGSPAWLLPRAWGGRVRSEQHRCACHEHDCSQQRERRRHRVGAEGGRNTERHHPELEHASCRRQRDQRDQRQRTTDVQDACTRPKRQYHYCREVQREASPALQLPGARRQASAVAPLRELEYLPREQNGRARRDDAAAAAPAISSQAVGVTPG